MYSFMIVDDESIFRDFLKQRIDWHRYGFRIAGEARDGIEALRVIQREMPDVTLVDINIPHLDGLELIERIKNMNIDTEIILITGHEEFNYARKAIKLGVLDYLLKPVDEIELEAAMNRAKWSIQKKREEAILMEKDKEQHREAIMLQWINGKEDFSGSGADLLLDHAGISLGEGPYAAFVTELDFLRESQGNAKEVELWQYAVTNILSEIMDTTSHTLLCRDKEDRLVSLIELRDMEDESRLKVRLQEFVDAVKRYLKFTITVGVGLPQPHLADIPNSYQEAASAILNKVFIGGDKWIFYRERSDRQGVEKVLRTETIEELTRALRRGDALAAEMRLSEVFATIEKYCLSMEDAYAVCSTLISICLSYLNDSNQYLKELFGPNFVPFEELRRKQSLQDIRVWITDLYAKVVQGGYNRKQTSSKLLLDQARGYIELHYADPKLSIENIVSYLHIDASYLRLVFRKELGMSPTEYVTHYRIGMAKTLIGEGNEKLSSIAEKVGYQDAYYFSKCFRKICGYSPKEYELQKKRRELN